VRAARLDVADQAGNRLTSFQERLAKLEKLVAKLVTDNSAEGGASFDWTVRQYNLTM